MTRSLVSLLAILTMLVVAACTAADVKPPPGPSPSDVNPITGTRGGSAR